MEKYLKQTAFFDFEHEIVQNFVKLHTEETNSLKENAIVAINRKVYQYFNEKCTTLMAQIY